jgi:RHS repeat-associated protein
MIQELEYDEWGRVQKDSNPGFQPFGYAGGLYDRDTKLVRFGARDYDPQTGTWTTKDPIGLAGGLNVYGYTQGNPVSFSDPTGNAIYKQGTLYTDIQPSSGSYEVADMPGSYINGWKSSEASSGTSAQESESPSRSQYRPQESQSEPQSGRTDYNLTLPPGKVNVDWDTFFPTQTKGGFGKCALKVVGVDLVAHAGFDLAAHVFHKALIKTLGGVVTSYALPNGITNCVLDSVKQVPNPNYVPYGR